MDLTAGQLIDASAARAAAGEARPRRGGGLTVAYQATLASLDPAITWEILDVAIIHAVFQGFFRYASAPGVDGTRLEPCLAVEVPTRSNGGVSPDGTTLTIRLRKGVRFQPPVEREVTAADFKYSFERMMNPRVTPLAPATYFYSDVAGAREFAEGRADEIAGVELLDDHTVRISLTRPDPSFLDLLTLEFCDLVPRESVEHWGAEFSGHPVGTGPFMLEQWGPREVNLVRNPLYWEDGRPYLDRLRYVLSSSPAMALHQLEAGQVDCLGNGVPPADVGGLRGDPTRRDQLRSAPLLAAVYLFLNTQMKPFDDVRVRQAVSWAVDREKLVRLQAGQGSPLFQVFPPGLPGHQPERRYYGHDPDRARGLLAEAGLPDGFSTSLYTDNVEPDPQLMRSVCDDLAAIGIKAELKILTTASFAMLQTTPRALPMGLYAWFMDFPDPVDWIAPLFTKSSTNAGVNSSFWTSDVLERMLDEARSLTDPHDRIARFVDMQDLVMSQAPYVSLYSMAKTTMCSPRVGGFYLHPVYDIDPTGFWEKP